MSELLLTALSPKQDAVPYSRPETPDSHAAQKIGFVGLGSMGYLMAQNLANHRASLTPLLVWNRTIEKAERLLNTLGKDKIRVAQDLAQVASECDVIITNLANDAVVKSVYETFAEALKRTPPSQSRIFVETSTIYPTLAGELDALVSSIPHSRLITCPVFGTPAVAEKAQLLLIMSGDYRSKKEVAYHLVPAIGRKVIDLGGNLEKAPTFKLIGNSMILGTLEVLAEAYTLAEKSGIGADNVHNLVQELLPAPSTVAYSDKMARDKFDGTVGFAIDGGIKDASHIRRLTAETNSPMPLIDVAHQHLLTARALHQSKKQEGTAVFDPLDWSGIIAGTRVAAGLDGFDSRKHASMVREDQ
ncbi:NAD-P-binding protein [Lyophyllum atratum]|nr:NAD-P-binding protein [Lyophyllum atratum]